ncbi:MAG: type II toxin-antitoxin system ParD family antitoxin [Pseudomonadota bacterium]
MTQIERMTVALPQEMAETIRLAVESGDYASSSEVFRDAIRAWKHKRNLELNENANIISGVRQGLAELKAGKTKPAEEVLSRLEKKYSDMM